MLALIDAVVADADDAVAFASVVVPTVVVVGFVIVYTGVVAVDNLGDVPLSFHYYCIADWPIVESTAKM